MIAPVSPRWNRNASELVPQRGMSLVYLGCGWLVALGVVVVVLL